MASAEGSIRVFVYGTLKPGFRNARRLLAGRIDSYRAAAIRGRLLDLPLGYPAAVPGEGWIHGYLLELLRPELLTEIDQLEGYRPHRPEAEQHYRRHRVPCFGPEGEPLGPAFAYFMDPGYAARLGGEPVAGGSWQGD